MPNMIHYLLLCLRYEYDNNLSDHLVFRYLRYCPKYNILKNQKGSQSKSVL